MKKMLFIMNPYAGQKRGSRFLADILTMFNRAGYQVQIHMTLNQGNATQVVMEQAAGMDLIVCCGGDGTFNEVVSGLMQADLDIPIGYIPAGSTNDFASSLKLPADLLEAARNILEGEPVAYDAGRFGERYFSYVASFGAFTKASYSTPQSIKNALGHLAYVLEGIQELSQIKDEHVRMEIDGRTVEGDYLFGAICNATSVGGVLTLDPEQVDMSDGLLEVLLIRAPQSLVELADCIQAVQNQSYNCDMITFCSGREILVHADPAMVWTLDGEREDGHAFIDVCNCHNAFRLMQKKEKHA